MCKARQHFALLLKKRRQEFLMLNFATTEYQWRQPETGAEDGDCSTGLNGMEFFDYEGGIDEAVGRAAEGIGDLAFDYAGFDGGLVDGEGGLESLILSGEVGVEAWSCSEYILCEGLRVCTKFLLCWGKGEFDHGVFLGSV
jgi:hypothetical protein